jgi:carbon monoxide dehydrogenase subunit G
VSERVLCEVNELAPVVGSCEVEVATPPEDAWEVLTAIGRWPSWNPAVKSVTFGGEVGEGATFRWKSGPGTITSTIQDVEPPRRIAWTGTSFGIRAIHVHTFESRAGGTLVRTEESYDGLVARLFRRRLQSVLDATLAGELQHLKAEAERRGHAE